jgi:lysophospholipase L1-like esterase
MRYPHVISWDNVNPGDSDRDPGDGLYDTRILAEGDSWFSLGGIPTSNLLFNMKFSGFTVVVNCARPGDTIRRMGKIAKNPNLKKAMTQRFGYDWDAIVLSGGGNDLIKDMQKIIKPFSMRHTDPADYCNLDKLDKTLEKVKNGYRKIIGMRDAANSTCREKPVIVHTYDWMTPRNSPARFFPFKVSGPWVYPSLQSARIPESEWNAISDFTLDMLRNAIRSLTRGANKLPNFHVVNTQDTITPAALGETGISGDWMNEIHPTGDGYKAIAAKISKVVRKHL